MIGLTPFRRARRLVVVAALVALVAPAAAPTASAAESRFDLAALRTAVAADDPEEIRRLLAVEQQASGSELRSDAATTALADEAASLTAERQVILLLARIHASQPDPALKADLLQRLDRHTAAERELDAAIKASAAAKPIRIDRIEALADPLRIAVRFSEAMAGDRLAARWQRLDASQEPPRLIDLGQRELTVEPGAGQVELPSPVPADAGPWRVTVSGRGVSTALLVDAPRQAPPPPAVREPPKTAAVPTPPPVAEPEPRWATQAINIRAQPRADAARVGQLKAGDAVRVLSTTADGWARIEAGGKQGFAALAYLSPTKPAPTAAAPKAAAVPPPAGPIPPKPIEGAASVRDTANLVVAGQPVVLFGISGLGGAPAEQLGRFIAEQGGKLRCTPRDGAWQCVTSSGIDVAKAALVNGAARAKPGAPADYLRQEEAARSARRGLWSKS